MLVTSMILMCISFGCDSESFLDSRGNTLRTDRSLPQTSGIPNDGLLAFYNFDGNASDATGNGHTGFIVGARPVRDRFDEPRSAYHFDGVNDKITLARSNSLKIQLPVSIAYWVKLDQVDKTAAAITTDFNTKDNTGVFATFNSVGANPSFSFGDGGHLGRGSRRTKHGRSQLLPGIWYHIAGVIKGADDIEIYINGEDDGGVYDGSATRLAYSVGPSSIGIRATTPGIPPLFFAGTLDELAIYSVALTPNDVRSLYQGRF